MQQNNEMLKSEMYNCCDFIYANNNILQLLNNLIDLHPPTLCLHLYQGCLAQSNIEM